MMLAISGRIRVWEDNENIDSVSGHIMVQIPQGAKWSRRKCNSSSHARRAFLVYLGGICVVSDTTRWYKHRGSFKCASQMSTRQLHNMKLRIYYIHHIVRGNVGMALPRWRGAVALITEAGDMAARWTSSLLAE